MYIRISGQRQRSTLRISNMILMRIITRVISAKCILYLMYILMSNKTDFADKLLLLQLQDVLFILLQYYLRIRLKFNSIYFFH